MRIYHVTPQDIVDALLEEDEFESAARFRSSDQNVPPDYRIDAEFNCLSNAENLADANPKLRYVEGWCRFPHGSWGCHAWCETREGIIVDPYFEWRFGEKQKNLQYKKAKPGERVFENDDFDPKEFAMTQLYDQPRHGDDIVDREGRTLHRSHNMAGIRRYAGRNVVQYVNIWPLSNKPHPPGGLEIRFRDGSSYRTRFEDYDMIKWTLMKWRNLYGAPLQVCGKESGVVGWRNIALVS